MATKALGDDLIPNLKVKIKDLIKAEMLNQSYPVGSIYMTCTLATAAQVGAALGGTWQAWGAGKVPIGVDPLDTDFNTAERTGGSKTHAHSNPSTGAATGNTGATTLTTAQIPAHTHGTSLRFRNAWTATGTGSGNWLSTGAYDYGSNTQYCDIGGMVVQSSVGGGGSHTHSLNSHTHTMSSTSSTSTLPSYVTCYMYKRTG